MKLNWMFSFAAALAVFATGTFTAAAQPSNATMTGPVYMPDYTLATKPLPDGFIAWDELTKTTDVTNGQDFARFTFTLTNVTTGNVSILDVHPSCGCTTVQLPSVPWTIPAGSNGVIKAEVSLPGKSGLLFKSVRVTTDHGWKILTLRINIEEPVAVKMTDAQIAAGITAAKVDRQAVFKGDCASCHIKNIDGKYGQELFAAICAVCHEAQPRATMVPDLHNLQVPTNEEFWRTWITSGKAGTLMPAFATSQGGPLTDMQIASLAAYLNAVNPSHVPQPAK
jgi:cytochrome c553